MTPYISFTIFPVPILTSIVLEYLFVTNFNSLLCRCFLFIFPLLASAAFALETIRLRSGELIEGSIRQMDSQIVKIVDKNNQEHSIVRSEISRIEFSLPETPQKGDKETEKPKNLLEAIPKPESKFTTPLSTFQVWREAAIRGDIDGMAECYVSYRQKDVKKDLKKLPKEDFNKMRVATTQTEFAPAEPIYQGDRASLEINWRLGVNGESQVLQFSLEQNDWKIIQ